MDKADTITSQATEQIIRTRPHGCFTALVILTISTVLFIAGFIWIGTVNPAIIPGDVLLQDVGRAVGFTLILLLFGLPALVFLRQPTLRLWRGMGLVITTAAVIIFVQGMLLSIDRGLLDYPGLPYAVPAMVNIILAAIIVAIFPERYFATPNTTSILLGLFCGALVGLGWVFSGVLGTPLEFLLSLLEAVGLALIIAVLMPLLFVFDPKFPTEWPRWSIVVISTFILSLVPTLLVVRGFQLQAAMVAPGILLAGFVYSGLSVMDEKPNPARQWPALFAFLLIALGIPLVFTEGLEGDWMPTALAGIWLIGMGAATGVSSFLSLLMLGLYGPLRKVKSQIGPGILAGLGLIAVPITYAASGGQGFLSDRFFVVMQEQTETDFAIDIEERDERVQVVYETLVEHADETQGELRAFLDERHVEYTPYYLVNGIEVSGGRGLRAAILRQPGVDRIIESPPTRPLPALRGQKTADILASVDDLSELQVDPLQDEFFTTVTWGLSAMEVPKAWEAFDTRGEGIIIGNADSGVDWQHPDLQSNYLGAAGNHDYHWFDPWEGTTEPTDSGGHGTHTAGSSFGASGIGVAPGASWIACRNLARNLGTPAFYLDCMQFLFAPFPLDGDPFEDGDPTRGAHVTNNSWGCPPEEGCDGLTLGIATTHLRNAGQMMVVSAGNSGPVCETIGIPATSDDVLSVGAVSINRQVTFFSSRGPTEDYLGRDLIKPDIVAPGQDVYSAVPGDGYAASQGTSMAGPHVAGLVALMWSANPELIGNIELTEFIIYETANSDDVTLVDDPCAEFDDNAKDNVYGFGLVNAYQAVQQAVEVQ